MRTSKQLSVCALLVMLWAPTVAAQDCTPTYGWGQTYWSNDPAGWQFYPPNASSAHVFSVAVPAGVIWKMRTIALATTDGREMEYFIEHLTNKPPYETPNYHRIAGGWGAGTPPLEVAPADAAALIALPGERFAGRSNPPTGAMLNQGMLLLYSYFSFPEACLARALGMEAATVTVTGSSAPPFDSGPLQQHLREIAAAATAAAASVP